MKKRYHIVHDAEGRILALIPAAAPATREGIQAGWRPVAGLNQFVVEVTLTATHARMPSHELLEAYRVRLDAKSGKAALVRRTVSPRANRTSTDHRSSTAGRRR
jgi:hypothetical protein